MSALTDAAKLRHAYTAVTRAFFGQPALSIEDAQFALQTTADHMKTAVPGFSDAGLARAIDVLEDERMGLEVSP